MKSRIECNLNAILFLECLNISCFQIRIIVTYRIYTKIQSDSDSNEFNPWYRKVWHWLTSITQLRDFLSSNHWQVPSFLRAFVLPVQQLSFSCFSVSKIYYSRPYIKDAVWANQLSSGDWEKSSEEKVIVFSYFNRNVKCEKLF